MDTDLCIFCQKVTNIKTFLVATFNVSDRIRRGAENDYTMRHRLVGITSLVTVYSFGGNTAHYSMHAKSYNRTIRAHKLTVEAVRAVDHETKQYDLQVSTCKVVDSLKEHNDVNITANMLKELEELVQI